jgi:hypothetical protein
MLQFVHTAQVVVALF